MSFWLDGVCSFLKWSNRSYEFNKSHYQYSTTQHILFPSIFGLYYLFHLTQFQLAASAGLPTPFHLLCRGYTQYSILIVSKSVLSLSFLNNTHFSALSFWMKHRRFDILYRLAHLGPCHFQPIFEWRESHCA